MGLRADLRFDDYHCRTCSGPLTEAALLRHMWRRIRPGEHRAGRGEFAYLHCGCWATNWLQQTVEAALSQPVLS